MILQNLPAKGRGNFRGNGRGGFQPQQGYMGGFQPQQGYVPRQDSAQFEQYSAPLNQPNLAE